ncbi:MAG: DUF2442 domain-containing protein [Chloroflexi bacterium]|nr:DUF2442 domain-containing protein [Chloroflexota bacterium]
MSIATIDIQPRVRTVSVTDDLLTVYMEDQRVVSVPLSWYPRLAYATSDEKNDWRVFEDSDGRDVIFWERLDELIPVVALLTGVPSRESKRSLERWLANRESRLGGM